jgi:hypothetical protein
VEPVLKNTFVPDHLWHPIPVVDRVAYTLGVHRNDLIGVSNANSASKTRLSAFTRSMNLDNIVTQFFMNTESVSEFIGRMRSLPPKKRRTGILFLLKEREKMYKEDTQKVFRSRGKTSIATLFLIKTWMTILLAHHRTKEQASVCSFSSLMSRHCGDWENMTESSVTTEFIVEKYFSSEEESTKLKEMVDNDPSLTEQLAVSHLTSVLCSDILCWPPYNSSHEMTRSIVYNEKNVWSFTCEMISEPIECVEKRGIENYGPYYPVLLKKEINMNPLRTISLFGCSYAQSVVLLDVVQYILRNILQGHIVRSSGFSVPENEHTHTQQETYNGKSNENGKNNRKQSESNIFVHSSPLREEINVLQSPLGEDSNDYDLHDSGAPLSEDRFLLDTKIEEQDPFLFFMQSVPQTNGSSAIIMRSNNSLEEMTVYFGTEGYCSTSLASPSEDGDEVRLYSSHDSPLRHSMSVLFSSSKENDCSDFIPPRTHDYLFNRYVHLISLVTLWTKQCWFKKYTKKKKYPITYQCPLYPILGQSLSMCYRDFKCILENYQECDSQGYLMDILSSQVAVIYKIVLDMTKGYRSSPFEYQSSLDVLFKDVNAGIMFLYSVPTLWEWCKEHRDDTPLIIRVLERYTRGLNISSDRTVQNIDLNDGPIVIEDDYKLFKQYKIKDCTQVLLNTHKKKRIRKDKRRKTANNNSGEEYIYKPLCDHTIRMTEKLDIQSITIAQSGPSSFVGTDPRGPMFSVTEPNEKVQDEYFEEDINLISESDQRTRFYFDEASWTQFLEHCIKVVWPNNQVTFRNIVLELIEHLYPFEDFAMEKLLHRSRKSSHITNKTPFSKEMLESMIHESCEKTENENTEEEPSPSEEEEEEENEENSSCSGEECLCVDQERQEKVDFNEESVDPFVMVLFLMELSCCDETQAESFLNMVLNDKTAEETGVETLTINLYKAYERIFTDTTEGNYNFHLPVEAPVMQKENRVRREKNVYECIPSYFDTSLCIPETLPGRGWKHFKEACSSSLVPDMLYLFGRQAKKNTVSMHDDDFPSSTWWIQ